MDYKKPQSTLVQGGAGIYPLTTADQVILADGSRLEKDGQVHADVLGGKSLAEIMLDLYPVGAVYISVNSTSPASLFGGTWEAIEGRFLLGANERYVAGSTGGTAEHVLTTQSIPHLGTGIKYVGSGGTFSSVDNGGYAEEWLGGGTTTKLINMPPYLAVYMWQRMPDEEVV